MTTVRIARAEDAEAIRSVYNEAVATTVATLDTEPRTREQQERWMTTHDGNPYPALVAEDADQTVIGWASLSPYNPKPGYRSTAEVSLYVRGDRRGQGVGALLLHALINEAGRRGFHTLVSLITSDNAASVRLHARQGFVDVGTLRRVGRKFDTWVDVTFMQRFLTEP